jgi:hypothetical protein
LNYEREERPQSIEAAERRLFERKASIANVFEPRVIQYILLNGALAQSLLLLCRIWNASCLSKHRILKSGMLDRSTFDAGVESEGDDGSIPVDSIESLHFHVSDLAYLKG